uniref:Uncharacterized protein n=1 Tax=viral metagenome TaxID=1070528 RepID=A0A6C0HBR3_9ZZZZ
MSETNSDYENENEYYHMVEDDNFNDSDNSDGEDYDFLEQLDNLYEEDEWHIEADKIPNKYYIGICKRSNHYKSQYLLLNSISSKLFYKTNYATMIAYLKEYSIIYVAEPKLEIMKFTPIHEDVYSVVIKTHWIRLIQRHWKKIISARKHIYKMRGTIDSLRYFETHGRYPYGLNVNPILYGMLCEYAK